MNKKKIVQMSRKYGLLVFCAVTAVMNVLNYVRMNDLSNLGTPYSYEHSVDRPEETASAANAELSDETLSVERTDAVVAQASEGNDSSEPAEASGADSFPVDINSAGAEELQLLPGIGPSKAAAILEYRNTYGSFTAPEELMEVKGIGEGIYNKLKEYITVEGSSSP